MSMTAWNGTAIITTESESRRQRHRNEKKKGETVSSSGLETERWLGALLPLGAKTNESGPDLATGSRRPRPPREGGDECRPSDD